MGKPDIWHIQDNVMQKTRHLWQMQASDREFSITQWYRLENSIYEYDRKQFAHITGRKNNKKNPKKVAVVKIEPVEQDKPTDDDDDDDPNVARTLSKASLDEEMEDASDWIHYPAEQSPEASSSTRFPDPPPLAFSVLASLKRP
ncbi:hypothetical protein FRC01_008571 [Tulasnella sp. 417]|nr:hypothetical protein FRC01_008571 [Tulasnella sp. 417]